MNFTLLLACYGTTFFIADSALTVGLRYHLSKVSFFRKLLSCYFCLGFWNSLIISLLFIEAPLEPTNWVSFVGTHIMHGFAGAAFTYGLNVVLESLERFNATSS